LGTSTSRPAEPPGRVWPFTVLAVLAVAGLTLAASRSPLFRMRSLEITGHSHLSREEVVRSGGLGADTNVLWMSPGEVEARLESNPWIEGASVARELPGLVTVHVRERSAVAAIRLAASSWAIVAVDGTALERTGADPRLPGLVVGTERGALRGGRAPRAMMPLIRTVDSMSDWLRARVRAVALTTDGSIEVRMRGGAVATYGPPAELRTKAGSLESVLRWAAMHGTRLASIDLRAPRVPTALPRSDTNFPSPEGSGTSDSR
jgi:cell division septal protein FtsQ